MVFRFVSELWRNRWGVIRLVVATTLLWQLILDNSGRLTRLQLASLPSFDYVAEVKSLRQQQRFAEAIMVADDGISEAAGDMLVQLKSEREAVENERKSVTRKVGLFLKGAVIGDGHDIESLLGTITADLLVVGDVRDIVIQGGKFVMDGEADQLIILLSVVGIATTVAPEIDWIPSFMKIARKAGVLSKKMVSALIGILQKAKALGRWNEVERLFIHLSEIAKRSCPATLFQSLKYLDDPVEIEKLAGFVARQPQAGLALLACS